MKQSLFVVGIDVGGKRKGLHAVALKDGAYDGQCCSKDLAEIVDWCRNTVHAQVIVIDAPCRWSTDGRARPAERQLMAEGIWCFSTPTRNMALNHRNNHYGWMLYGEQLFRALETTHPVCNDWPFLVGTRRCFETFPHAVTSALGKQPVSARNKRRDREALLRKARIDTTKLTNIDLVDAGICALTAHFAASGESCKRYGEPATGWIIVPATL